MRVLPAVGAIILCFAACASAAVAVKPRPVAVGAAQVESVTVGGDKYEVQWLARESFDKTWASRWVVEGDCAVKAESGRLWTNCIKAGKVNAATIWYRTELPADVIVRFRAKVLPPEEDNSANLNVILSARETDGRPVAYGRSGVYGEYHKFPNYIVTLTGGVQPGWSRVRKNPGFVMLHEANLRSEAGKEYDITVTVQKGRIRYYVNGKKWHDVKDASPLPGGKFAIRTWSTNAWWSDVRFGRLLEMPASCPR